MPRNGTDNAVVRIAIWKKNTYVRVERRGTSCHLSLKQSCVSKSRSIFSLSISQEKENERDCCTRVSQSKRGICLLISQGRSAHATGSQGGRVNLHGCTHRSRSRPRSGRGRRPRHPQCRWQSRRCPAFTRHLRAVARNHA